MICDKFPFGPSYQILNKCVQCRLYNIILWKLETIWFITWLSHYFIPFHHWIFQNRSKKYWNSKSDIFLLYENITFLSLLVKFLQHRNIQVNTEWYAVGGIFYIFYMTCFNLQPTIFIPLFSFFLFKVYFIVSLSHHNILKNSKIC